MTFDKAMQVTVTSGGLKANKKDVQDLLARPFGNLRANNHRAHRGKLVEAAVAAKIERDGTSAEQKQLAAATANGKIDWAKLLELLVKYLPQILAIILPLFKK